MRGHGYSALDVHHHVGVAFNARRLYELQPTADSTIVGPSSA
jgi:hypothetical protein